MSKKNFIILLIIICYLPNIVKAQKTVDIGIWGGTNTYWGDLNNVDHFDEFHPTFGLFFRHTVNPRIGVRIMYLYGKLSEYGDINGVPWNFTKNVHDISIQAEINYLKYFFGVKNTKYTPYITGGIGMNIFPYTLYASSNPDNSGVDRLTEVNIQNPLYYFDGEQRPFAEIDKQQITANIAFGFGIKYNVFKRMAVGIEYQMRKSFSDKIDNLDDPLAHELIINNERRVVTYTTTYHNNDWIGYLGAHITYKINIERKACPAYDRKYN